MVIKDCQIKPDLYICGETLKRTGIKQYVVSIQCEHCTKESIDRMCLFALRTRKKREAEKFSKDNEKLLLSYQSKVKSEPFKQLTKAEMLKNFGMAMTRFAAAGFRMVDEKTFIERQVCCTTCQTTTRCPYCGCLLKFKDRLASEKTCPNPTTYPNLKQFPPRNYWDVCNESTTVIISCRGEPKEWLERTVQSLRDNATGKLEVITVMDEGIGKRATINKAAKSATGDYLFILDSHCLMSEGWDTKLKCTCGEKDIAISAIQEMDKDWTLRDTRIYYLVNLNKNLEEKWSQRKPEKLIERTGCFTGCGWMIKKDTFNTLGGFDESLGDFGREGPEWAIKVYDSGGVVYLRDDVICGHIFNTNKDMRFHNAKTCDSKFFIDKMKSKYQNGIDIIQNLFGMEK